MRASKTRQSKSNQSVALLDEAEGRRLAGRVGVLLGIILGSLWVMPSGAYPGGSLALCGLLTGSVLVIGGAVRAETKGWGLAGLSWLPLWVWMGLTLYSAGRWGAMEHRANGREMVTGLLWAASAMAGVAWLTGGFGKDAPRLAALVRRTLVIVAIGFTVHAIHQYTVGFNRILADYRAGLNGPVNDLHTQSMLHILSLRRVTGRLGNPNLFAAQMCVLSVACLSCLWLETGRLWRWVGGVAWVGACVALWLTDSRGGQLTMGFVVVCCGMTGWLGLRGGGVKEGVAKGMRVGLGLLIFIGLAGRAWSGWRDRLDTVYERFNYWQVAWDVWRGHFWLGGGPGAFELGYPLLKPALARESRYAHSWIFQAGADLGVIGLAGWVLFWGAVIWLLVRNLRRYKGVSEASWPLLGVLTLAFNGLFEFSLMWREFLVALGVLTGLACGLSGMEFDTIKPLKTALREFLVTGVALGLLVLTLWVVVPYDLAARQHWLGREATEAGAIAEGAAAFGAAARWEPDNPQHWVAQASALVALGHPAEAWEKLSRAAELQPQSASIRAAQGAWLESAGRLEDAMRKLDEAVERYPTRIAYRLERVRLGLKMGRGDAARDELLLIEREGWPVWDYEKRPLNELREQAGLPRLAF